MTYIVLDLEWNQPISYQSSTFRKVGDKLVPFGEDHWYVLVD